MRCIFCSLYLFFTILTPWTSLYPSEAFIFHHIPKTAGTTVTYLLDKNFAPEEICRLNFYYELEKLKPEELTRYTFFRGHFFYSQLRDLPGKRITFIRDPVQRVLSEHRFWMQKYRGREEEVLYLGHFLPAGDPLFTMQNHQCLFLSSLDPRDPTIPIQNHLESAKFNLANNFFFVGIMEDLERGLRGLYVLMGWPPLQTVPHLQKTDESNETVSKEVLAGIWERNWADRELYLFAQQLYLSKLKEIENRHRP